MAKVKCAIRKNEVNVDGKVNVKLRIFHNGKTRYIGTDIYVEAKHFLSAQGRFSKKHPYASFFNSEMKKKELELEKSIQSLPHLPTLDISSVLRMVKREDRKTINMFDILKEIEKEHSGKGTSTSTIYKTTRTKLERYVKIDFLDLREIDYTFLRNFHQSLIVKEGNSINTAAIDLRNLRSAFNRAIDDGLVGLEYYPFRKFKIPKEKTPSRALSLEIIRKLYNLKETGYNEYALDVFFLSFFLIGINMKDLYSLKPSMVVDGRIDFRRAKTGRNYSLLILPEVNHYIKKYKGQNRLFCFHKDYSSYQNFIKAVDKFLKRVDEGKHPYLTTYYARHSWATLAGNNGIPKDVIKVALGHGQETVTDVYIDYDLKLVDDANRKVVDLLKNEVSIQGPPKK